MTESENSKFRELEELISLKLEEGKFDEAEKLSSQLIRLAEDPDAEIAKFDFPEEPQATEPTESLSDSSTTRSKDDIDNLNLLGIFSYVLGGLAILVGFLPGFHILMGVLLMIVPHLSKSSGSEADLVATLVGGMFTLIGLAITFSCWLYAGCMIHSGRCLRGRRKHRFSLVMGAISCAFVPVGTVIGVFTIITLRKPEVRKLYGVYSGTTVKAVSS